MNTTATLHSETEVLTDLSASALAAKIACGDVSATEVVEAHIARIEQVNPTLNAVVSKRYDAARAEAQEADRRQAKGEPLGPLHGVPITIKDAFDTAGVISTGGTKGRAMYVPEQDATAVARLRAAGAIILGKTNLPELSLAFESDNLIYGRTNNPYDLARTPGGSSGGEAAIIAAGGSPLGLGTDAAGSLRVPSHFCGIATIKPTSGRVPLTGALPPAMGSTGCLWHAGPLARRVEDLILTLPLLSGPDWRDPLALPMPLDHPADVTLKKLRIAFYTDNGIVTPTAETVNVVQRAANVLAGAGAAVEEGRPSGIEQSYELIVSLFAADGGASLQMLLQMAGTTEVHPLIQRLGQLLHPLAAATPAQFANLMLRWDMFRSAMLAFMEQYDVIICPVNAHPAMLHGTTFDDDKLPGFSYAMTYNLTGWPAAVIRGGTSPEGLPIGVQIVARPWREEVALAVAQHLETALGAWQRPPL
ncbi:MAG: amidase [Chloroflexi bacterium]|nr:amidase [Chloroflexota bacterium]